MRNLPITHVNQVWSADITYVPLLRGFMYLVAVFDWHSRYVLAWQLSNTLDGGFCLDALRQALVKGRPEIFNTDQGAQFTADAFTACLLAADIRVSMDGRGRALDNVFCERLWRSVKYENIYLNQHDTVRQLHTDLISAGTRSDVELAVSCRAARASSFLTMRRPAELAATCGALGRISWFSGLGLACQNGAGLKGVRHLNGQLRASTGFLCGREFRIAAESGDWGCLGLGSASGRVGSENAR